MNTTPTMAEQGKCPACPVSDTCTSDCNTYGAYPAEDHNLDYEHDVEEQLAAHKRWLNELDAQSKGFIHGSLIPFVKGFWVGITLLIKSWRMKG